MAHVPVEAECRYCHEHDVVGGACLLIAPCQCNGDLKWVHRTCLDNWRTRADVSEPQSAFYRCEICHGAFEFSSPSLETRAQIERQLFIQVVRAVVPDLVWQLASLCIVVLMGLILTGWLELLAYQWGKAILLTTFSLWWLGATLLRFVQSVWTHWTSPGFLNRNHTNTWEFWVVALGGSLFTLITFLRPSVLQQCQEAWACYTNAHRHAFQVIDRSLAS